VWSRQEPLVENKGGYRKIPRRDQRINGQADTEYAIRVTGVLEVQMDNEEKIKVACSEVVSLKVATKFEEMAKGN
jgi:hypothetical protein